MTLARYAGALEELYQQCNCRGLVHPDPLETLYRYNSPADREVVALVASSLAYGNVRQILVSVDKALAVMGKSPSDYVRTRKPGAIASDLRGFVHRFCDGGHLTTLLCGASKTISRCGSLEACFVQCLRAQADNNTPAPRAAGKLLGALAMFVDELDGPATGHLLPDVRRGSACKRLHLMLRWLVRRDKVDLGDWSAVSPADLMVPMDTHMHAVALALGITRRASADGKTAAEVTAAFRQVSPADPVRYDFALTRFGMARLKSELARRLDMPKGSYV